MRSVSAILLSFGILVPASLTAQRPETGFLDRTVTIAAHTYRYQVYVPATYSPEQRLPIILFLHGIGERGSDGLLQTNIGLGPAIRRAASRYPALVIFPQVPPDSTWAGMPSQIAMQALDQTLTEFHGDSDRVYVTGLSMGGSGTWYLAYRYPQRFAAIAPLCSFVTALSPGFRSWTADQRRAILPVPDDTIAPFAALAHRIGRLPTWIFHGEADPVILVTESRQAAEALRLAGGDVRYTELPGLEHNIWDAVYASQQFTEWLFAQRRRP